MITNPVYPSDRVKDGRKALLQSSVFAQQYQRLLAITLAGLKASLHRHMPTGDYRDFYLWAISAENPHQDVYLQAVGITQLVKLTVTLLEGLADEDEWHCLLNHTVPMNVYQIYEIVSDNLAIGLAAPSNGNAVHRLRRDLLCKFNNAMVERLNGAPRPAEQLLGPLQPAARHISLFEQSLTWRKHRVFAEAYLSHGNGSSLNDLDYALWPLLVANVEACADLAQSVNTCQLGHLLRAGLTSRYQAVNRLLRGESLTLPQLAKVGTHAILVIPTLAYYVAVLAEIIQPMNYFPRIVADGMLADALYDAALVVRLLNDLGTELLTQVAGERAALLERLEMRYYACPAAAQTVTSLLVGAAPEFGLLTRVHKDILFGEFNVVLHNLANSQTVPEALSIFGHSLDYFSQLYANRYTRLVETLALISERLGDERVSQLVFRFVRFHQELYGNVYSTSVGEYAI